MAKWDGLDRRRFPRARFPCLVIIKEGKYERAILTHTENMSVAGVCVVLKEEIKMFEEVQVEMDLMDFQPHVVCKGKVVWTVQRPSDHPKKPSFYDIGIELFELSDNTRQRVDKIVENLTKNQSTDSGN